MKTLHAVVSAMSLALILSSCGTFTREERDVHTFTYVDTTTVEQVMNQPGDRDNGIVYPSSRTVIAERTIKQTDSVAVREYPNFIRLSAFEGIGMIGSTLDGKSTQAGLFGVFPSIDDLLFNQPTNSTASTLFSGSIYRFGIVEWKMHWFSEDPDWTWGVTAVEIHRPDDNQANWMTGYGVLNIRKRFYLRKLIPYAAITPHFSIAVFPSPYASLSVSADIGSIGGVNLKAVTGYTMGLTSYNPESNRFVNYPYFGLGISLMDFLNREEELNVEWKNHEHSAWELSGGEGIFVGAGVEQSFWSRENPEQGTVALTGFTARMLNATIALPILDKRIALGTSLVQFMVLGLNEFAVSMLPIRASYFWQPFNAKFVIEPFIEYNYAPSTFTHLGIRGALPLSDQMSVVVVAGYASGSTGSEGGFNLSTRPQANNPTEFNQFYFGIGLSVFDRIFGEGELRYGKGYPHE